MLEPDPAAIPAVLVTRWRAAQDQLFGSLLMQPEEYEQVVPLLADVTAALRERATDSVQLRAAADDVDQVVAEAVAARGGMPGLEPYLPLVGLAALAMRWREIGPVEAAAARRTKLTGASGWVVLEESGDRDGPDFLPYHRLEAHAEHGWLIDVAAGLDGDGGWTHLVADGELDLPTGRVRRQEEPGSYPSAAAREAAVEVLRAELEAGGT